MTPGLFLAKDEKKIIKVRLLISNLFLHLVDEARSKDNGYVRGIFVCNCEKNMKKHEKKIFLHFLLQKADVYSSVKSSIYQLFWIPVFDTSSRISFFSLKQLLPMLGRN